MSITADYPFEAPGALSIDLTGIRSAGVRQSVRDALDTIGYRVTESDRFWPAFATGNEERLPAKLLVFSDLASLARRFVRFDKHQWIAGVRRSRPYFVTYLRTKDDQRYADLVDDMLLASDLRIHVCRETSGSKVRDCLETAIASLEPDSLREVRYSSNGDGLWVVFGDGLSGAVSWQSLGLGEELQDLYLESATPAPGAKAIEIATASGGLFHIGSASVRAVIDQKFAQKLSHDSDAATRSLGERLRKARETSGITQQELESRSGLAQALISKLERGKHQPRFDTLQRYADGLGVSVTSLLSGTSPASDH